MLLSHFVSLLPPPELSDQDLQDVAVPGDSRAWPRPCSVATPGQVLLREWECCVHTDTAGMLSWPQPTLDGPSSMGDGLGRAQAHSVQGSTSHGA